MMDDARPISVVIAEDEALARGHLRALVERDARLCLAGLARDGAEAVAAVEAHAPDLLLLDIQMPGVDGFGVARALPPENPPLVVFVTAFDHFALEAFEASAVDYLLKPVTAARFTAAIDRAVRQLDGRAAAGEHARLLARIDPLLRGRDAYPERFLVKSGGGSFVVMRVAELEWVESARNHVVLHAGGRPHLHRDSMDRMEALLDPSRFVRIRRSAIVNLDRVESVHPWSATEFLVRLRGGKEILSSRGYRHRLRDLMLR